jgi:hypothetical protein
MIAIGHADLLQQMQRATLTDVGMARFLNGLFGDGGWTYDRMEDVWLAPDRRHRGPGRGFLVIQRGGNWRAIVVLDRALA